MSLLNVNNLSFSYPNQKTILGQISFSIEKGERVGLIGPNGSGKTTLFLLLCGVLKCEIGQIFYYDQMVRFKKFNPGMGYLFQNPDEQLFNLTLFEDVAYGPKNLNWSQEKVMDNVHQAIDSVGLYQRKDQASYHLSGGEKRLGALASILSMDPDLLLLDEPVSNLDAKNRRKIIGILDSLKNKTLFIASHDLEFLLETCDRCILLDEGKIIADQDIRSLLLNEKLLSEHHLEKPHSLIPHTHLGDVRGNPKMH